MVKAWAYAVVSLLFAAIIAAEDLVLSRGYIRERLPIGSVVGVLSDADSPDAVFSLVSGSGDDDNAKFAIQGRLLRSATILTAGSASIRIHSEGSGGTDELALVVTVYPIVPGWVMGWGSSFLYGDTPVWTPPDSLGQVEAIGTGYDVAYAIRIDGSLVKWQPPSSTFDVIRPPQNWVAVDGGLDIAVALRGDGTVETLFGTPPPAGLTGVIAIACGNRFCLALKNDGSVVTWGAADALYPQVLAVPGDIGQVVAIAAGDDLGLALRSDGTIKGWGRDNIGQASGFCGKCTQSTGCNARPDEF